MSFKFGCVTILLFSFFLSSCAYKEEQKSLYPQEPLKFKPVTIRVDTKIDKIVIDPAQPAQWAGRILGALIPPLPFKDRSPVAMPPDVPWTDPKILPFVLSVKLVSGSIQIVPEEDRGPFYKKNGHCFLCGPESLEFLSQAQVNLVFMPKAYIDCRKKVDEERLKCGDEAECEDQAEAADKVCNLEHQKSVNAGHERAEKTIYLAKTDSRSFNKNSQELVFKTTNENLRPYFTEFAGFDAAIDAKGKIPKRTTYIEGYLTLEFVVQLPKPY
jgi:hypothetical protein